MKQITSYLVQLSDDLDKNGKIACANAVDSLIQTQSLQKIAQYVGVIGYVLKQNKAMSNCIRKKSEPSMHDRVFACLKEYQDGQNYNDTEWTKKYAQVIKSEPDLFDVSMPAFLESVSEESKITEHLDKIKSAQLILHMNEEKDTILDTVLNEYNESLKIMGEGNNENFFKEASPGRAKRPWWRRIWNPYFTEKGNDDEAKFEMSEIIKNIENIKFNVQKTKTSISRIKNDVGSYSTGSNVNLGNQSEDQIIINNMVQQTNNLDATDWNKTVLSVQQLNHLINQSGQHNFKNPYNVQIFKRTERLLDDIRTSTDGVYNSIHATQELMRDLRQRTAIIGREQGLQGENGEKNPYAQTSPAEEYYALDKILNQLYKNPLDEKAIWYAERLHARLDDKLRYIERPQDEEIDQWLNSQNQNPNSPISPPGSNTTPNSPNPTNSNQTVAPTNNTQQTQNNTTQTAPSVNPASVQQAAQHLKQLFPNDIDSLEQIFSGLLNPLLQIFGNIPGGKDAVEQLVNGLINNIKSPSSNTTNIPTSVNTTEPAPQANSTVVNNSPVNTAEDQIEWPPASAEKHELGARLSGGFSKSDLIKMADILDKVDPSIGDVIDKMIQEHSENEIKKYIFPSHSILIKQEIEQKKSN